MGILQKKVSLGLTSICMKIKSKSKRQHVARMFSEQAVGQVYLFESVIEPSQKSVIETILRKVRDKKKKK